MISRKIILGCLILASFFVACNSEGEETQETKETKKKVYDLNEESELVLLMRKMYEDNLDIKRMLENDSLPSSFPQDFRNIHDAIPTEGMLHDKTTFDALAKKYVLNIEKMENAKNVEEAKIAYNEMVLTCSSCHQVYCQGPLVKINKMPIKIDE